MIHPNSTHKGFMNFHSKAADIFAYADDLIEFSEAVRKENKRNQILKHFYEQIYRMGFLEFRFSEFLSKSDNLYFVCDGKQAIDTYISIILPPQTSPIKTIDTLHELGMRLKNTFIPARGQHISKEEIHQCLQYLDKEYDFIQKVFAGRKPIFMILEASHLAFNSQCIIEQCSEKGQLDFYFVLCSMNNNDPKVNHIYVFFHELGHALHYTIEMKWGNKSTKNLVDFLGELYFPDIIHLTQQQQAEFIADVFAIGFMYESPFAEYDIFDFIEDEDKEVFSQLIEKYLNSLSSS